MDRIHDDESLLNAARDGDNTALEELLARHYGMVRAFVRLRVDPATRLRESVSDLVQSICREVLQRADRFEYQGEAAFRSWLCEAALRKLRDRRAHHLAQRRDPAREVRAADGGWDLLADAYRTTLDPVGHAMRIEEIECLELAFDTLSEDQREAITLRRVCGLSYAEIGQRLGSRSEAAARQLTSRGLARLGSKLHQMLGEH